MWLAYQEGRCLLLAHLPPRAPNNACAPIFVECALSRRPLQLEGELGAPRCVPVAIFTDGNWPRHIGSGSQGRRSKVRIRSVAPP